MKCLYCGKDIPEINEDSIGRKINKKVKFCRGTDCHKRYWRKHKKDHIKAYNEKYYLDNKKGEI